MCFSEFVLQIFYFLVGKAEFLGECHHFLLLLGGGSAQLVNQRIGHLHLALIFVLYSCSVGFLLQFFDVSAQILVLGAQFGHTHLGIVGFHKLSALFVYQGTQAGYFLCILLRLIGFQLHHLHLVEQSFVLQLVLLVLGFEVGNACFEVVRALHYGAALTLFAHQAVFYLIGFLHGLFGAKFGLRNLRCEACALIYPLLTRFIERAATQVAHIVAKLWSHSHIHGFALFLYIDAIAHKLGQIAIDDGNNAVEHAVGELLLHLCHGLRLIHHHRSFFARCKR